MTNQDKKDSIRRRMAGTGEPYNVARHQVEAVAGGGDPKGKDPYQLIEVEVGSDAHFRNQPPRPPRHIETFWGRWLIAPDPETARPVVPGRDDCMYYAVAETRRGRIAVYTAIDNPVLDGEHRDFMWVGELSDYDSLAAAQLPPDIKRQVAVALDVRDVVHRDI